MREKSLRRVAIVCFLTGIVMLFFISGNLERESEPTRLIDVTARDIGRSMKVCGVVTEKFVSGEHIFLRVRDETSGIKAVIFENSAENLLRYGIDVYDILEGDRLCLKGEISEWEGEIEIIVDWVGT